MSQSLETKRSIVIDSRQPSSPVRADRSSARAKERELNAIGEVLNELARPAPLIETVLGVIAENSAVITNASGAAIVLLEHGDYVCRAMSGVAAPLGSKLDPKAGLMGECIRTGNMVRCDDAETDTRVDVAGCRALNVRSVAAVPLEQEGTIVGLLEISSSQVQAFGDEDLASLQRMASAVLAAINRAAAPVETRAEQSELSMSGETQTATQSLPRRTALVAVVALALVAAGAFTLWRSVRPQWATRPAARAAQAPSAPALPNSGLARQLRVSAEAGDANSQFLLGSLYIRGQGVPEDYQEAAKWFVLAAQQGNIPAQSMLGTLYSAGRGVPQDYVSAYLWTRLAADSGNEISKNRLPQLTGFLSPDRLSEAQNRVAEWRRMHTETSAPPQHAGTKQH